MADKRLESHLACIDMDPLTKWSPFKVKQMRIWHKFINTEPRSMSFFFQLHSFFLSILSSCNFWFSSTYLLVWLTVWNTMPWVFFFFFLFKLENNKFWAWLPDFFFFFYKIPCSRKNKNTTPPRISPVSVCFCFLLCFLFAYLLLNYQHYFSFLAKQIWIITK